MGEAGALFRKADEIDAIFALYGEENCTVSAPPDEIRGVRAAVRIAGLRVVTLPFQRAADLEDKLSVCVEVAGGA